MTKDKLNDVLMGILEAGEATLAEAAMTAGWLVLQLLTLTVACNEAVTHNGGSR